MEYDYESTQEMDDAKEDNLEDRNGEQEDSHEDMYMMKNENPEHESSLKKNFVSTSNVFEDVSKAFMQERETENSLYNSGTEYDSGLGSTTLDDSENLNIGRKYRNMKRDNISKKYSKRAKESELPNSKTTGVLSHLHKEKTTRQSTMTSSTSEVVSNAHENASSVGSRYARCAYGVNGNVLNLDEFQTENKADADTNPREMPSNSEKYENVSRKR